MTTTQILLMLAFYFLLALAVIYFTRAKPRRILGAFLGGAAFGLIAILGIVLGEDQHWWHIPQTGTSHFYLWMWFGTAVCCTPTYLIIWRAVRRWGARGFAVCLVVSTIIGPPRDYWIAHMFPAWMTFAPGIAPIIADAAIYSLLVIVGYAVMRVLSGSATSDRLR